MSITAPARTKPCCGGRPACVDTQRWAAAPRPAAALRACALQHPAKRCQGRIATDSRAARHSPDRRPAAAVPGFQPPLGQFAPGSRAISCMVPSPASTTRSARTCCARRSIEQREECRRSVADFTRAGHGRGPAVHALREPVRRRASAAQWIDQQAGRDLPAGQPAPPAPAVNSSAGDPQSARCRWRTRPCGVVARAAPESRPLRRNSCRG